MGANASLVRPCQRPCMLTKRTRCCIIIMKPPCFRLTPRPQRPPGLVESPSVSMGQRESRLVQTSRTLARGSTPQRLARPGGHSMNTSDMFIGIDVSKAQLDIAVRPTQVWYHVSNTPKALLNSSPSFSQYRRRVSRSTRPAAMNGPWP